MAEAMAFFMGAACGGVGAAILTFMWLARQGRKMHEMYGDDDEL